MLEKESALMIARHFCAYKLARDYVFEKEVLDIGCGEGYGSHYLSGYAKRVTGIDYNPDVIAYAKKKYIKNNLDFFVFDVKELDSLEKKFDVICCFQNIEHITDDRELVLSVSRLLKENGVFICSTCNMLDASPGKNVPSNKFHVREYLVESFRGLLGSVFAETEIFGLKRGLKQVFFLWLKRSGFCNNLPYQINPVSRFYEKAGTDDFTWDNKRLNRALDFIAICRNRKCLKEQVHFDTLASQYDEQLPAHIKEFLLAKKTRLILKTLNKYGIKNGGKGIDLGCGTGWYLKNISEYGYDMLGIDSSSCLIDEAKNINRNNGAKLERADILSLKYPPESFDFAYCINSLHHLQNNLELEKAFSEIHKVLKKGGLLIIHEVNTFFLFRFYMNYIFPLTNKIDKFGGENWIVPRQLSEQKMFEVKEIYYYTFLPHIIPKFLFGLFSKINNYLERVSLRKFGVHYMAVLKK